jgi:hypothetical protein
MNKIDTNLNYKPKSIIVGGEIHEKFKTLCKGKCMKIGAVVENLMFLYLTNSKEIQKLIDTLKENK